MTIRDSLLVYMNDVANGCGLGTLLFQVYQSRQPQEREIAGGMDDVGWMGTEEGKRKGSRLDDGAARGNETAGIKKDSCSEKWVEGITNLGVQVILLKGNIQVFHCWVLFMQKVDQGGIVVIMVIYCCQKIRGLYSAKGVSGNRGRGAFITLLSLFLLFQRQQSY